MRAYYRKRVHDHTPRSKGEHKQLTDINGVHGIPGNVAIAERLIVDKLKEAAGRPPLQLATADQLDSISVEWAVHLIGFREFVFCILHAAIVKGILHDVLDSPG